MSYCIICRAQLREGVNFCPACGAKVQQQPSAQPQQPQPAPQPSTQLPSEQQPDKPPPQQQTAPVPPPQQPYQQQNVGNYPKKSYGKILGAIIGVVIILIILLVVFFVLLGDSSSGSSESFVGTWIVESIITDGNTKSDGSSEIILNSDGSAYIKSGSSTHSGTWEVKNNKFFLLYSTEDSESPFTQGLDFTFENNNRKVTLSYSVIVDGESHSMTIILNKKSSNGNEGGNGNLDSRFIGTWEVVQLIEDESSTSVNWDWTFTFNSDGNVYEDNDGITDQSTWSATNNQICGELFYMSDTDCYNFQFTQNDDTLSLDTTYYEDWDNQYHTYTLVLTKS
jgi:hypothetical protein